MKWKNQDGKKMKRLRKESRERKRERGFDLSTGKSFYSNK